MNSEEQFIKSLNDKLDAKEFAFDQNNWEKARVLIDASKNKRRRFLYFIFAGILFVCGSLTMVFLLRQTAPISEKDTKPVQTSAEVEIQRTPSASSSENSNNRPVKAPSASVQKPGSAFVAPAQKIHTPDAPVTVKQNNANTNLALAPSTAEEPQQVAASGSDTHGNAGTSSGPELAAQSEQLVKQTPVVESNNEKNEVPTTAIASAVVLSGSSKPEEPMGTAITSISGSSKPEEPQKTASASQSETPVSHTVTGMETEASSPVVQNNEAPVVPAASSDVTTSSLSSSVAVAKPDTDYVRRKKPVLLFEAGANYLLGWKTGENKEANGFSPVVGINLLTPINNQIRVSVGLQYSSIRNLNFSSYTSKITTLDLGEESEVTVYTPSTLHYLIVPVRLHYRMSERNVLGGGVNLGYLMAVSSKVESYRQTISGITNVENSKSNSYHQGFVSFDTQISAFYIRSLGRHFHAKAELFYGFGPVKDQNFFPSGAATANRGIKLTILYDIFKNF